MFSRSVGYSISISNSLISDWCSTCEPRLLRVNLKVPAQNEIKGEIVRATPEITTGGPTVGMNKMEPGWISASRRNSSVIRIIITARRNPEIVPTSGICWGKGTAIWAWLGWLAVYSVRGATWWGIFHFNSYLFSEYFQFSMRVLQAFEIVCFRPPGNLPNS